MTVARILEIGEPNALSTIHFNRRRYALGYSFDARQAGAYCIKGHDWLSRWVTAVSQATDNARPQRRDVGLTANAIPLRAALKYAGAGTATVIDRSQI
jgi:hypothetical protein